MGTQPLQCIKTADLWHFNVQQHQIHGVFFDTFQQFVGIFRESDDIPLAEQSPSKHVPVHFIVIYDKQSIRPAIRHSFLTVSKVSSFSAAGANLMGARNGPISSVPGIESFMVSWIFPL